MDKEIKCYYLGKMYTINVHEYDSSQKNAMVFDGESFHYYGKETSEDLNKALIKFYKKKLKRLVDKRLKHYSNISKLKYKSYKIEDDPRRWGSCNGRGELTFNYKLMIFPPKAIDYVVVHELCHTKHLNHDRSFWRLVGKYCPDYMNTMKIIGSEKTREI